MSITMATGKITTTGSKQERKEHTGIVRPKERHHGLRDLSKL